MKNYNNLHQKTNFIGGSPEFEHIPFLLTSVNIPGMNFSHPELGARGGVRMKLGSDTVTFNALSFEMLVDEDLDIYREVIGLVTKHINVSTGEFSTFTFNFWLELNNNKGNKVMKMEFHNCRIDSIGDLELDTQDDITEYSLSMDITYDYFEIEDNPTYTELTSE